MKTACFALSNGWMDESGSYIKTFLERKSLASSRGLIFSSFDQKKIKLLSCLVCKRNAAKKITSVILVTLAFWERTVFKFIYWFWKSALVGLLVQITADRWQARESWKKNSSCLLIFRFIRIVWPTYAGGSQVSSSGFYLLMTLILWFHSPS